LKAPKKADEWLLVEAAQTDPARFADLYESHFERVYAFIAGRVCNRREAEDLTSEVFRQALQNLRRFEWRGVPFAGLAAANRCQRHSGPLATSGSRTGRSAAGTAG